MKDINTKPGEEQNPPAAPSVIRDERRWERGKQEKKSPAVCFRTTQEARKMLPAFD